MSTYAIGDIQGCWAPFSQLLKEIAFDPDADRLWLAGDLVNRGPASVRVLSWIFEHRSALVCVLGNHDVHLLKRAAGVAKKKKFDTLEEVLAKPKLLDWLRRQPLVHREGDDVLVHAGVLPKWSWKQIEKRASEASAGIRKGAFQKHSETLGVLTRLRMVDAAGKAAFGYAGPPEGGPPGEQPWFAGKRKTDDLTIYFGHWAALGHRMGENWVALDSGCVWGGKLTAVRLEDRAVFQVDASMSR